MWRGIHTSDRAMVYTACPVFLYGGKSDNPLPPLTKHQHESSRVKRLPTFPGEVGKTLDDKQVFFLFTSICTHPTPAPATGNQAQSLLYGR